VEKKIVPARMKSRNHENYENWGLRENWTGPLMGSPYRKAQNERPKMGDPKWDAQNSVSKQFAKVETPLKIFIARLSDKMATR